MHCKVTLQKAVWLIKLREQVLNVFLTEDWLVLDPIIFTHGLAKGGMGQQMAIWVQEVSTVDN